MTAKRFIGKPITVAAVVAVLGIFVMLLTTEAQQIRTIPRVGMLLIGSPSAVEPHIAAFRQGLRERGYVVSQNIALESRLADVSQRLPDLATELVRIKVDVIVAQGTPAAQAARRATGTIPIVMAGSGDPVAAGLVESLARPGGNVTGNSILGPDLGGKRLELLREILPGVSRIAVLLNPNNPMHGIDMRALEAAAKTLGIALQPLEARSVDDFERAFGTAASSRAGAMLVSADAFLTAHRMRLAHLAAGNRLPTIYGLSGFAEAGGLISYGVSPPEMFRRAATYVDKILKGAKPADLPIEQPTKFELVINLKTAKALGLTIPHSVLIRADRIIQ